MRWFFDLLPAFIILFVVISVIRGVVRTLGRITPASPAGRREAEFDPAEAERTRRIQEEIRRKIAERRGQVIPAAGTENEPPVMPAVAVAPEETAPAPAVSSSELQRQNLLLEELRTVTLDKQARQRRVEANLAAAAEASALQAAVHATRDSVLTDLQDPAALRRAFVLREILDRPVALR